jgi:hypothetical protein
MSEKIVTLQLYAQREERGFAGESEEKMMEARKLYYQNQPSLNLNLHRKDWCARR